jgi:hypothetical protein
LQEVEEMKKMKKCKKCIYRTKPKMWQHASASKNLPLKVIQVKSQSPENEKCN